MKFLYFNQLQPNNSWKSPINNNITIVPKNIKNDLPTNSNECKVWSEDCPIKAYKFNANPIKHYRKQYVNVDSKANTFSNLSLIGSMDKPGNNIVTQQLNQNDYCSQAITNLNIITYLRKDNDCLNNSIDKFFDATLNKVVCNSLHPSALVIKTATTNLSNNYSSSQREYLYNKNKTFKQNLPLNKENTNDNKTSCVTYAPSNKKFQTQGSVSSSARTFSLKYGCLDGVSCNKEATINDCPANMSLKECNDLKKIVNSPLCYGCINDPTKIRRKRINILKG